MPPHPDINHDRHDHHDQGTGPLPHPHLHQFSALPKRRRTAMRRAAVHLRENDDHWLPGCLLPQKDSHRHGAVPLHAELQDRVCDLGCGDQDGGMLLVAWEGVRKAGFRVQVRGWENGIDRVSFFLLSSMVFDPKTFVYVWKKKCPSFHP